MRATLTSSLLASALFAAPLVLGTPGCDAGAPGEPALDDEGASFGFGKADGPAGGFSACELREVLKLVNESATTVELLKDDIHVHTKAALRVVAHRVGPDGIDGTADDDLFDDLAELDAVPWVGPKALEAFANYAAPRCEVDLATRPFISKETFAHSTGGGWGRDAPEFEATMTVTGAEPRALYEVLNSTDSKDRTIFSRLRKNELMTAFTYGFAIDEMPWGKAETAAREAIPYVALSIEKDRYVQDDGDNGPRELSLGTDIFDDVYYDTKDYDLFNEGMVLRGRARWDSDTTVRRLLIQAKSASTVDDNGIKSASKVDVRTDSGDRYLSTLDDDVRSGTVEWTWTRVPVEPIKTVYDALEGQGLLHDMQGYEGVLILDPKADLRSKRSRFHFNLTDRDNLTDFYKNGLARIQQSMDTAQAALDAGTIEDGDKADVEAMIALGQGIVDGSLIKERALEALKAVPMDPVVTEITTLPDAFAGVTVTDQRELDIHKAVAAAADDLFDEFSDALDGVDKEVAGTRGLDFDEYVDLYVAYRVSKTPALGIKTTYQPFQAAYRDVVAAGDQAVADEIAAFNTFGDQQKTAEDKDFADFVPMTQEAWAALGHYLDFEVLKISQRQITNAGTLAHALWFELARKFYVPKAHSSAWSNFVIDTFDVTYFVTPEEWARIPVDQRTPAYEIPGKSIFHTKVVNEVQIELTEVEPYIERIQELKDQIAKDGSTPELEQQLAGAQFILDESIRTLQVLGELKGDDIVDRLKDEGLKDVAWEPAKFSKGQTAMRILTDTDASPADPAQAPAP